MDHLLDRLRKYIDIEYPYLLNTKLLLGVSGGADSMVMLHLFTKLRTQIAVAHVNYQLRGEDSNLDQKLVEKTCLLYNVECHVHLADSNKLKTRGVNLQSEARNVRYQFFKKLMSDNKYTYVLTAHHQQDNVETVLLNYFRGTGLKGLTGISVVNESTIRPLLNFSKEEILTYADEHNVLYREDRSNQESYYTRNALRNQIIPQLDNLFPDIQSRVSRTTHNLSLDHNFILEMVAYIQAECFYSDGIGWVVNLEQLMKFGSIEVLLVQLLKQYGFNSNQIKDILNADQSGRKVISSDYTLYNYDADLVLVENKNTTSMQPLIWNHEQSELGIEGVGNFVLQDTMDSDKLHWPLQMRSWQDGDRMMIAGRSVKLKDYFSKQGYRIHEKINTILIVDSKDQVLALFGKETVNSSNSQVKFIKK